MGFGCIKMKNGIMKSWTIIFWLFPCFFVLMSCSSDDYLNVVPQTSTAVVAVDANDLCNSITDKQQSYIKDLFKVNDLSDCGIDVTSKAYVFETVDGNLGLVVKVKDADDLSDWLNDLSKTGYCKKITTRRGFNFTMVKNVWMMGFSSDALLIMGPVLPVQQADMQRQMIKYLEQDEEQSIKVTPLFEKLDSLNGPVAIVAQVAALPEKFVAPFTIGAPKDADASQIMVAAEVSKGMDGIINIKGETFSFNKSINDNLVRNKKVFRSIKGSYCGCMSKNSALGIFLNVKGKDFINLLHQNNSFQALLAGMNTAIDMDNIIRSVDGDMAIVVPSFSDGNNLPQMSARLANKDFLADVEYWKKSCPAGSKIVDWENNSYYYTDGNLYFYFGVSDDLQFFSGNTPEGARCSILKSKDALSYNIQKEISGKHMCFVLNVGALLDGNDANSVWSFFKPLLGDVKTVLYSM